MLIIYSEALYKFDEKTKNHPCLYSSDVRDICDGDAARTSKAV